MPPLPHPVWAGVVVASRRVEWTSAGVAWPVPCGIFYKVIHLDKHIAGRRLVTASCMLRGCIVRARSLYNVHLLYKTKSRTLNPRTRNGEPKQRAARAVPTRTLPLDTRARVSTHCDPALWRGGTLERRVSCSL